MSQGSAAHRRRLAVRGDPGDSGQGDDLGAARRRCAGRVLEPLGGTLRFKLDAGLGLLRHLVVRRILGRPMAYDPNNIFAKILRGELPAYKVYEDEKAFAFLDIMPRAPGHTLVLPKAAARNILDVQPDDLAHVAKVAQMVAKAALKAFDADGVTVQQFNEPAGGQVRSEEHTSHLVCRLLLEKKNRSSAPQRCRP